MLQIVNKYTVLLLCFSFLVSCQHKAKINRGKKNLEQVILFEKVPGNCYHKMSRLSGVSGPLMWSSNIVIENRYLLKMLFHYESRKILSEVKYTLFEYEKFELLPRGGYSWKRTPVKTFSHDEWLRFHESGDSLNTFLGISEGKEGYKYLEYCIKNE